MSKEIPPVRQTGRPPKKKAKTEEDREAETEYDKARIGERGEGRRQGGGGGGGSRQTYKQTGRHRKHTLKTERQTKTIERGWGGGGGGEKRHRETEAQRERERERELFHVKNDLQENARDTRIFISL